MYYSCIVLKHLNNCVTMKYKQKNDIINEYFAIHNNVIHRYFYKSV